MLMKRNYSLGALRAFYAAARHCHFTAAARELSLSQSAVSQRVALLERQLRTPLFRRIGRHLALTEEGRRLAAAAASAFSALDGAVEAIGGADAGGEITLSALPSFAMKWLIPRLGEFRAAHPGIDLRIRADNRLIDVERENVDAAVVIARPKSPKVKYDLLMKERIFAVCAPSYLARTRKPLKKPADLRHHPLLHDETERDGARGLDWDSWFAAHNIAGSAAAGGTSFTQGDLVLQAAIAGQGVALTRTSIAALDIKNGLLVNPFGDLELAANFGCYICALKADADKPKIAALRKWLLSQARADSSAPR
jgi:LysR family glycine cleavage system transcriptional activator